MWKLITVCTVPDDVMIYHKRVYVDNLKQGIEDAKGVFNHPEYSPKNLRMEIWDFISEVPNNV